MTQTFWLMSVTLVVLALAYAALGVSLILRKRRHNAGFTCASASARSGMVHGCVCRDRESARRVPQADGQQQCPSGRCTAGETDEALGD